MGRRIEVPDSPRRALYVGDGLLYRGLWQQSHWSELEFFDWGIRLQSGALLKRLGACYEFRYEELAEASLAGKMVSRGVLFRTNFPTNFPPQPPMFLTVDGREILDRLEQRGVSVNRNVTPLMAVPLGARGRRLWIVFISIGAAVFLLTVVLQIARG